MTEDKYKIYITSLWARGFRCSFEGSLDKEQYSIFETFNSIHHKMFGFLDQKTKDIAFEIAEEILLNPWELIDKMEEAIDKAKGFESDLSDLLSLFLTI